MVQLDELAEALQLFELPPGFEPSDNIAPGTGITILTDAQKRTLETYYWGLIPSWAKDITIARKTFNARAETLAQRPSFKNAFRRRRALIPATSYYEWSARSGTKVPYRFALEDAHVFTFAGLWEYWMDSDGNEVYSATIITTEPNELVAEYHTRMPVIIDPADRDEWMMTDDLRVASRFLKPIAAERMTVEAAEIRKKWMLF